MAEQLQLGGQPYRLLGHTKLNYSVEGVYLIESNVLSLSMVSSTMGHLYLPELAWSLSLLLVSHLTPKYEGVIMMSTVKLSTETKPN